MDSSMITTVEEDQKLWKELSELGNTFISSLLRQKEQLTTAAVNSQHSISSHVHAQTAAQLKEALASLAHAQGKILELKRSSEGEKERFLELSQYTEELERDRMGLGKEVERLSSLSPSVVDADEVQSQVEGLNPAKGKSKRNAGPPYILVLIDGSSATFADDFFNKGKLGGHQCSSQIRWEVEKDIREFDVPLPDIADDEKTEIITYVYYNKAALVASLLKAQVISSAVKLDEFVSAFNAETFSNMIDIGSNAADTKIAAILAILAPNPSCKGVYLAGLHPGALIEFNGDLDPLSGSSFAKSAKNKIFVINHRETESDRAELARYRWRVTLFKRFFSVNGGLGSDWGFNLMDQLLIEASDRPQQQVLPARAGYSYDNDSDSSSDEFVGGRPGDVLKKNAEVKGGWGEGTWQQASGSGINGGRYYSNGKNGKEIATSRPGKLKINPNKGFLNQDPPICVFHYLATGGCTAPTCRQAHNYGMSPAQFERLRKDVSKVPCKEFAKSGTCKWGGPAGDKCLYWHRVTGSVPPGEKGKHIWGREQ